MLSIHISCYVRSFFFFLWLSLHAFSLLNQKTVLTGSSEYLQKLSDGEGHSSIITSHLGTTHKICIVLIIVDRMDTKKTISCIQQMEAWALINNTMFILSVYIFGWFIIIILYVHWHCVRAKMIDHANNVIIVLSMFMWWSLPNIHACAYCSVLRSLLAL